MTAIPILDPDEVFSNPVDGNHEAYFIPITPDLKANSPYLYKDIQIPSNKWIEMACSMAVNSVKEGGGPFGTVLVQIDDQTNEVLRYWKSHNQVTQLADPTAHAEVMAIRSACRSLGVFDLGHIRKGESILAQDGDTSHCELFSSCEPCPMCYSALFWARIPVLYFAATRFDASKPGIGFSDKELYDELAVPFTQRKTRIFRCNCQRSTDAFRLWESSDKIVY